MKKITFWLLLFFSGWQLNAQVSTYVFSQSNGTYTPITGGLILGTTTSDDQKFVDPAILAGGTTNTGVGFPIGFNFTFNGQVFDRVAINNNGWISLGQSTLTPSVDINSTSSYTPLSSTVTHAPTLLRNRIAGLAADLQAQTGSSLRIETIGTAPNRSLVVQWTNYRRYTQTGQNLSFQIVLNETVNTVDVVYDALTFNTTSSTANVGLGGTVSTDFDNRSTTTNWNATINGTTNTASCTFVTGTVTPPVAGLKFTWTPGPACSGMPFAGTALPANLTLLPTQAVGNISVSDYTPDTTGFTFQWQESIDNGVTWNNVTGGSNATTPTYTAPAFSGTSIQYRLAVTCTATGDTAYSTISYVNACGAYTVPMLENLTTFLPQCWMEADNGDLTAGPTTLLSGSWLVDGFANSGTTGAARVTLDGAVDNDWVITPLFTIPATGYELKFDAAATQAGVTTGLTTPWESDDFVEVLVSTGMTNWTVLYTYNDTNVPSNLGSANIIDLDAFAGQNVRFAYRAVEGASNGAASVDFFIDNFEIRLSPSCPDQTGLVLGNVTAYTVDASWTDLSGSGALAYEYAVTTSATPPASGTVITNAYVQATGLLPQTVYYFHVRANCAGSTYGNWITGTFTTACAPVTTFPVLEPFATFLPSACWIKGDNGDLTAGPATFGTNSWFADGFANVGTTGAMRITLDGAADNDWVISPEFTIPAIGYELKFDAAATQSGATTAPTTTWESDDFVEVLVSNGLNNWTPLYTYTDINVPSNTLSPNIIDLDAYAGQTVRFAYRGVEGTSNGAASVDFFVDNFEIRLSPACPDQTGLILGNVTAYTVDASWTDLSSSGVISYEYVVTTSATPPASGTSIATSFVQATGLTPQTVYYFHVRPVCSGSTYGNWLTGTFTTACAPITTLPWTEGFEGLATVGTTSFPPCWFKENGDWASQNTNGTYSTARTGTRYIRDSWSATNEYIWTPGFNLVAGTSYDFSSFVQGDNGTGWIVDYFVNTTQNSTGATQIGATYNVPGSGGTYSAQAYNKVTATFVPATSGTYYFAVRVNQASSAPWYVSFDDFELILTPACPSPNSSTVTNLTPTSADVSWNTTSGNYEYVIDNTSSDPAGAGTAIATNTYSATGLTSNTVYYVHVRSNCSGTFSPWFTFTFTTPLVPPANDNCAGAIALTPGATFASNPLVANLTGATNSNPPAPGCASFIGGDVWYSVVVPASGNITIETGGTFTGSDTGMAVYSGTCGALTLVLCDDDTSANGNYSLVALTGRTPGEVLYITTWQYNTAPSTISFEISAYDASLNTSSFDLSKFAAYPNPVKDILNLNYTEEITNVQVINMLGQEVINKKTSDRNVQVNLSNLNTGTYLVKVTSNELTHTMKVIKN